MRRPEVMKNIAAAEMGIAVGRLGGRVVEGEEEMRADVRVEGRVEVGDGGLAMVRELAMNDDEGLYPQMEVLGVLAARPVVL